MGFPSVLLTPVLNISENICREGTGFLMILIYGRIHSQVQKASHCLQAMGFSLRVEAEIPLVTALCS